MKIIYRQTSLKHSTSDVNLWNLIANQLGVKITIILRGTSNWIITVNVEYSIICEGDEELINKFDSLI